MPAPRRATPLTTRLVDRWCDVSLEAGWAVPGAWWTPATQTVVEALLDDDLHLEAYAELAGHRAAAGVTLAETLDDLSALFVAARLGTPPYPITRAVSVAWVEAHRRTVEAVGCIDPRHGLGTVAHVEARLGELYQEGTRHGFSPSETHTLVVVQLHEVAESNDPWTHALRLSDVAQCLRTVFDAGQVMGLAGTDRVVVVAPRAANLPRSVEALRRLLNDWRPMAPAAQPGIWIEALPLTRTSAGRLLASLTV
ncbi:MAG TPA: hypothetical protein VE081_14040 [Sporichthyaceae bacterium]|nr:hypothetical protein [Sporichthyaceae bacterium]